MYNRGAPFALFSRIGTTSSLLMAKRIFLRFSYPIYEMMARFGMPISDFRQRYVRNGCDPKTASPHSLRKIGMQQQKTSPKTDRKILMPQELLDLWHQYLRERDRSGGTVRKYTQAVAHFLAWYEREEQTLLSRESLTPITLIGYRNELQHA